MQFYAVWCFLFSQDFVQDGKITLSKYRHIFISCCFMSFPFQDFVHQPIVMESRFNSIMTLSSPLWFPIWSPLSGPLASSGFPLILGRGRDRWIFGQTQWNYTNSLACQPLTKVLIDSSGFVIHNINILTIRIQNTLHYLMIELQD